LKRATELETILTTASRLCFSNQANIDITFFRQQIKRALVVSPAQKVSFKLSPLRSLKRAQRALNFFKRLKFDLQSFIRQNKWIALTKFSYISLAHRTKAHMLTFITFNFIYKF